MEVRETAQFWTFSPRTRRNSLLLFVTSVTPATTACAAIQRSLFPIISPLDSSAARIDPYASTADSGKESAGENARTHAAAQAPSSGRQVAGLCVDGGHALEGGKGLDGFSGFLLGDAQIVEALQIDPEFGAGAEEMRQAQRRVGRDVAASVQNLGDAIGNPDPAQLDLTLLQVLARRTAAGFPRKPT